MSTLDDTIRFLDDEKRAKISACKTSGDFLAVIDELGLDIDDDIIEGIKNIEQPEKMTVVKFVLNEPIEDVGDMARCPQCMTNKHVAADYVDDQGRQVYYCWHCLRQVY